MFTTIRALLKDESGATAIEYALLVAGVSLTLLAAFTGVTDSVKGVMDKAKAVLNGAGTSSSGGNT